MARPGKFGTSEYGVALGSFEGYANFNNVINDVEGSNNNLMRQAEVTAAVPHARDLDIRYQERNSLWPGRGEKTLPMAGTAAFRTEAGVSSILNGIKSDAALDAVYQALLTGDESVNGLSSGEAERDALSAQLSAIGIVRNAETRVRGKLNKLMTLTLGGATNIVVPPGTPAYTPLVWELPLAGTNAKTHAADVPNVSHAILVPVPYMKTQRPRQRVRIHRRAARTGKPAEQAYGTQLGRARFGLIEERKATENFVINSVLASIKALSIMGIGLTGLGNAQVGDARNGNFASVPNLSDAFAEAFGGGGQLDIESQLDWIFERLSPNPNNSTPFIRQNFLALIMPTVYGDMTHESNAEGLAQSYRRPVGSAGPRVERLRFSYAAAEQMYTAYAVRTLKEGMEIKAFTITSADDNGNAAAVIYRG